MVKGAVKAGYSAAATGRELAVEAREQVEDLVAEACAERDGHKPSPPEHRAKHHHESGSETVWPAAHL